MADFDRILDEKQTADRIGLSMRTLRENAKANIGPARLKLSARRVGYRESDVAAWIASRCASASGHAA